MRFQQRLVFWDDSNANLTSLDLSKATSLVEIGSCAFSGSTALLRARL